MSGACFCCGKVKNFICIIQVKETIKKNLEIFKGVNVLELLEAKASICTSCLNELNLAYKFYLKCIKGMENLKHKENSKNIINYHPDATENTSKYVLDKKYRTYSCKICNELFESAIKLKTHEKSHILEGTVCDYCNCFFEVKGTLDNHIYQHHLDKRYNCRECTKSFLNHAMFLKHIKSYHNKTGYPFSCYDCKKYDEYHEKEQLVQHVKEIHYRIQENSTVQTTDVMPEEFLEKFLEDDYSPEFLENFDTIDFELNNGFQYEIETNKEFVEKCDNRVNNLNLEYKAVQHFECPKCDIKLQNLRQLKIHLQNEHKINFIVCPICLKGFNKTQKYKKHVSEHTKNIEFKGNPHIKNDIVQQTEENIFKCTSCNKEFKSKGGLKYHIKVHSALKPYTCPYCQKKFATNENLIPHMHTMHALVKPYKCCLCDKEFGTVDHLKKHVTSIHGKEKNYFCSKCDKRFAQLSHLKRHEKTHEKNKNVYTIITDIGYPDFKK